MCVLLEILQKTWAIPIMNPLSWFMIILLLLFFHRHSEVYKENPGKGLPNGSLCMSMTYF